MPCATLSSLKTCCVSRQQNMSSVIHYIRALQQSGIQRPKEYKEDDTCRLWYYEGQVLSGVLESNTDLFLAFPQAVGDYLTQLVQCNIRRPPSILALKQDDTDTDTFHLVRQLEKFVLCGNTRTYFRLSYTVSSQTTCWLQKQGFHVRHYNTLHNPITSISWTPPHHYATLLSLPSPCLPPHPQEEEQNTSPVIV